MRAMQFRFLMAAMAAVGAAGAVSSEGDASPVTGGLATVEHQQDFRRVYGLSVDDEYLAKMQDGASSARAVVAYDPTRVKAPVDDDVVVMAPGGIPMTPAEYEDVFAVMSDTAVVHGAMPALLREPTFSGAMLDEAGRSVTIATNDGVPLRSQPAGLKRLVVLTSKATLSLTQARLLADSVGAASAKGDAVADSIFEVSYDPIADVVRASVDELSAIGAGDVEALIQAQGEGLGQSRVKVIVEKLPRPMAGAANTTLDPRTYGGARILSQSFGGTVHICTQSFHVNKASVTYGVTAAHCSFIGPGVWHGDVGGDFGGTGPWNPNEVWTKSSWTKYYNQRCTNPHQTWTNTNKTTNWAYSDVALLDYWAPTSFQGRVYDPTHGNIRVRETVIPLLNEWVMTYGAQSNPSTQRIVSVSAVHVSLDLDMPKRSGYPGGNQCLRTRMSDMFKTAPWGSTPQIAGGDSGGPITKTVWRNVSGTVVAVALPVGVFSTYDGAGTAWHSYMWNVNNALGVNPLQGP